MAYKVRIADTAKTNLDEIIRYIAEKLSNLKAAVSLLADFEKCKNNLKDLPYMYPLCNDTRLQKKGFLFYKNYVALYSINDKGKIVNILHIFYAKCDYAKSV